MNAEHHPEGAPEPHVLIGGCGGLCHIPQSQLVAYNAGCRLVALVALALGCASIVAHLAIAP